ncbi:MAG: hypothetical protein GY850_04030 [bacterium]|nr:hypothetical protein [bacterium]
MSFDDRRKKNMFSYILCCLSIALLMLAAPASDCLGQDAVVDYSVFTAFEHIAYFESLAEETKNHQDELRLIPKADITFRDNLAAALSVEFRKNFTHDKYSRIFIRDGYLDISTEQSDLRLGSQLITWGRADGIKPTDLFKRYDFTDLIERRVEEILAFKWDYYFADFTIETVWAPIFQEDIVSYDLENRWLLLPREVDVPFLGAFKLDYDDDESRVPADDPSSSQFGVRLDATHAGWDFSGMYAWTYDRSPTFVEARLMAFDLVDQTALIKVTPRYKRIHVFGGDWATTLSKIGFRGEVAYFLTDDPHSRDSRIDDPYLKLVGGFDYNFTDLIKTWDLFVSGQFALDTEIPHQGDSNQDSGGVAALRHFYEYALLVGAELKFSPFSLLKFQGFVNLEEGDHLTKTEFIWKPLDGLALALGADFLGGGKDTFFYQFRSNDRFKAEITYEF